MSFSQGLGAGYNVTADMNNRKDRRAQQVVENDLRGRRMDIFEATENRTQTKFDAQRDIVGIQEQFTSLAQPEDNAETRFASYKQDVDTQGQFRAVANIAANRHGGDMASMMQDKTDGQFAAKILFENPKVKAAIESNEGFEATGIVPMKGENGETVFTISLVDKNDPSGTSHPMTKDRGSNKDVMTFSGDEMSMLMAQSFYEAGAFKDPQLVAQMEEAGYDMEGMLADITGKDFSSAVPKATSLTAAKMISKDVLTGTLKKNKAGKKLHDGTATKRSTPIAGIPAPAAEIDTNQNDADKAEISRYRSALNGAKDATEAADIAAAFEDGAFKTAVAGGIGVDAGFGGDDIPDDSAVNLSKFTQEGAGFGGDDIPDDSVVNTDPSGITFSDDELSMMERRRARKQGGNATELLRLQGLANEPVAAKEPTALNGIIDSVSDAATTVRDTFSSISKHLHGGKGEDAAANVFSSDKVGAAEAEEVGKAFDDKNTEVPQETGEKIIEANVGKMSSEGRVLQARKGIKDMLKFVATPSTRSRAPTPKQKATAAVMRANGILGESAYNTYLETGKFSFADVTAAAALNNSRAKMMKEQNSARTSNDNAIKDKLKFVGDSIKAHSGNVVKALSENPYWNKQKDKYGSEFKVNLGQMGEDLMHTMTYSPRVWETSNRKSADAMSSTDIGLISEFLVEKGIDMYRKKYTPSGFFSMFDEATDAESPSIRDLEEEFVRWNEGKLNPSKK